MKNKINKFYYDDFDEKRLALILPKTRVFFTVPLNGKYNGSFVVKSKDNRKIRGTVYSSNYRMQLRETGFDGISERISFVFDAAGLPEGEMVKGKFDIVTEAGEYEIPFTASVEIPYIETSMGHIINLTDFAKLAAYNFREAATLFESVRFRELLIREKDDISNLYEGFRKLSLSERALEEFLVGSGYKEPIKLVLGAEEKFYEPVNRSFNDILEIGRNTWGFLPVEISIEGDFIRVDRKRINAQDFEGNKYELEYSVRSEKLHDGVNTGYIIIRTPYETLNYKVIVDNSSGRAVDADKRRRRQKNELIIIKSFIDYRMGILPLDAWVEKTSAAVSDIESGDDDIPEFVFIRAFMALEQGDKEGAGELLSVFDDKRWSKAREAGAWSCYAYLVSRANSDLSYTLKVTEEIRRLNERVDDNWLILWVLLQIEEYLIQNTERRLQIIEEQWNSKNFHTLLQLEAYLTICEQPALIDLSNNFIIRTLLFAKRRGILTEEIAATIAISIAHYKVFNPLLFEILEGCYEARPSKDILSSICRYLIFCHATDSKYFYWFELGVRDELHIARLYEFFMYSINEDSIERLPQAIYLYFGHQNELNSSKKAFMYANLVRYMEDYPDIYENNRDQMEHFARTQLKAGKITTNLRTLYRHFLPYWTIDKEMQIALADILYTYEIRINDPRIRQVVVLYNNMNRTATVPLLSGKAQIRIYTGNDKIILKDDRGDIYVSTIPYELVRLFPEERYLDNLKSNGCEHMGLVLDACESGKITDYNVKYYEYMIHMEGVRELARKVACRDLLFYFDEKEDDKRTLQYLNELEDVWMDGNLRSRLANIYMSQNQMKKVFDLIRRYGFRDMDLGVLMRCCGRYVREDAFRENEFLLNLSFYCFVNDAYDDSILKYLVDYYCGRTADMIRIWNAASETGLNLHSLEERILIQMLFAEEVIGEEEIFYDYYIHGANEKVKKAYLSYKSYGYFVSNKILDEKFFEYIETEYARNEDINISCKLASLKFFAGKKIEDKVIIKMLEEFIREVRTEEYSFAFLQNYDDEFLRRFSLNNHVIIQYQGEERSRVTLHYCIHKPGRKAVNFEEAIMTQTYHTYFLKEFLLFAGEVMDYYIVEENDNGCNVVKTGIARQNDEFGEFTGRFSAINNILKADHPEPLLDEYERNSYLVTQLFRVL